MMISRWRETFMTHREWHSNHPVHSASPYWYNIASHVHCIHTLNAKESLKSWIIMSNKGTYLHRANGYSIFPIIHFTIYPQTFSKLICNPVECLLSWLRLSTHMKQLQIKQFLANHFNENLHAFLHVTR
jgi:hypothetical protein